MKTTTKEARQNIRQYILDHFDPCGYDFPALAASQMWPGLFWPSMQKKRHIPRNTRAEKVTQTSKFLQNGRRACPLSLILVTSITVPPLMIWAQSWSNRRRKRRNIQNQRRNSF